LLDRWLGFMLSELSTHYSVVVRALEDHRAARPTPRAHESAGVQGAQLGSRLHVAARGLDHFLGGEVQTDPLHRLEPGSWQLQDVGGHGQNSGFPQQPHRPQSPSSMVGSALQVQ
jgi:hypothetical protein